MLVVLAKFSLPILSRVSGQEFKSSKTSTNIELKLECHTDVITTSRRI